MANGQAGTGDLVNAAKGATQTIGQLVLAFNTLSSAIQGTTSPNSFAANGYFQFPGGLILNWNSGATVSGAGSVTFSKAFPNACLNVLLTPQGSGTASDYALAAGSLSKTGCNVYGNSGQSLSFYSLAIGY